MARFACLRVKGARVLLRGDGPAQGSIFCVLQRGSHVSAAKKIQVFSFFFLSQVSLQHSQGRKVQVNKILKLIF